jgi:hypothetical protein
MTGHGGPACVPKWAPDPPHESEKAALAFKSFSNFLRSRSNLVGLDETRTTRTVRLHSDTFHSLTIAMDELDDRERAQAG